MHVHFSRIGLVLLALVMMSRAAYAAGAPMIGIQIDEMQVRYSVGMPIDLFDALVGADRKHHDYIDVEERAKAEVAVRALFREKNPVRIDGVMVVPTLDEMVFLPSPDAQTPPGGGGPTSDELPPWLRGQLPLVEVTGSSPSAGNGSDAPSGDGRINIAGGTVRMVLIYETKGRPRHASIVWRLFPEPGADTGAEKFDKMRAGLIAFGEFRDILFTRDEPEFLWHALEAPDSKAFTLRVSESDSRATWSLPLLTLLMAVAIIASLVVMRRRKTHARMMALVLAPMLAVALTTSGSLTMDVALFGWGGLERPADEDARPLFEALHRNIYRAFDYRTENDIYDALAQSVDGELLDEIYTEVYTSLVMRDSGGAVCKVQSVKFLDIKIEDIDRDAHAAGFAVACRWQVMGSVTHWGHTHFRTNEYRAKYDVEPRGESWKITSVSILQHSRIDDDNLGGDKKPAQPEGGQGRD
jgi:hypothetical protein